MHNIWFQSWAGSTSIFAIIRQGRTVSAIQDIPQDRVLDVYLVIMRKLAEVHVEELGDRVLTGKHEDTQSYWQEVVSACVL